MGRFTPDDILPLVQAHISSNDLTSEGSLKSRPRYARLGPLLPLNSMNQGGWKSSFFLSAFNVWPPQHYP